jgi:RNA polymerase sigma-70 factor (ECF subfamily)
MTEVSRTAEDPREELLPLVPHLRAFARSLTGNVHDADDLVQDTVVLALQAWARFTPGTNLKAWLFTILHNRFITVRSRKHHRSEIGTDDLARLASVPATQESHVELRAFREAFAKLSPGHREVLVLAGVHGLAYDEIARICDCELGTVKSRINRARTMLKAMLLGESDGPIRRRAPRPHRPADMSALRDLRAN